MRARIMLIFMFCMAIILSLASAVSFDADSILIKNSVKLNSSSSGKIVLTSYEKDNFYVKIVNLEGFALLNENKLEVEKNSKKEIIINFSGKEAGIFLGALEISNSKETRKIPIILEVESKEVLFDSETDVYPIEKIYPGNAISLDIKIFDLYNSGVSNVEVDYFIKSFDNEEIFSGSEKIFVDRQAVLSKSFMLPEDIKLGDYVFGAYLKYRNSEATSVTIFKAGKNESKTLYCIIAVVIFLAAFFIFMFWINERKNLKNIAKIQEKEIKKVHKRVQLGNTGRAEAGEIKLKLESQLEALKRAYSENYIGGDAYLKGRKRIENLRKKIK